MRPFRFQAAWLSHELFADCLKEDWKHDIPLYPLLFNVSIALTEWNKHVFGNLFHRKKGIWARLEGIQRVPPQDQNPYLLKLQASLRNEFEEVLNQIEAL